MDKRSAGLALLALMILARIIYFESSDLWIDEIATLHHTAHWSAETMQIYAVNTGFYKVLDTLALGNPGHYLRVAQGLSLLGLILGWWAIGARTEERSEDPFWPQAILLVWPPLFVFSCVIRSYCLGVGLFLFVLWLLDTKRLREGIRLALLFVSLALAAFTLYMFALLYIPIIFLSRKEVVRRNFYTALTVPIVFWPVTQYVIVQTVLHKPQIGTTGASGQYWGAAYETLVFFNWPHSWALVIAAILMALFVVGRWGDRDLVRWGVAAVLLCGTMQFLNVNSFPRQGLPFVAFFIPGIVVGCRRLSKLGPAFCFILICLVLPYSLNRSVKTNGSQAVAAVIRAEGRPTDRIAVGSGFQGVPLDYLLHEAFPLMKTRFERETVPEFFGVGTMRVAYSEWDYITTSMTGERLWILDRRAPKAFENWPLLKSWPIDSGGNGARTLELRQRPE